MSSEDVVIVPYRDGPYLVRGPLVLRDQDGRAIELTRRTVALCRCGKSRMRPFCDGTHRLVHFHAPSTPEDPWTGESDRAGERAGPPRADRKLPPPAAGAPMPAVAESPGACPAGLRRARASLARLLAAAALALDPESDAPWPS